MATKTQATKQNKYSYVYIVQGYYITRWEDLCCDENRVLAFSNLLDYRNNAPEVPYRIIKRRIPF
jgi:hypothetical protein